jgi:hypothetical protein
MEGSGLDQCGAGQGKPGAVVSTVMNFGLHKVQVTS